MALRCHGAKLLDLTYPEYKYYVNTSLSAFRLFSAFQLETDHSKKPRVLQKVLPNGVVAGIGALVDRHITSGIDRDRAAHISGDAAAAVADHRADSDPRVRAAVLRILSQRGEAAVDAGGHARLASFRGAVQRRARNP